MKAMVLAAGVLHPAVMSGGSGRAGRLLLLAGETDGGAQSDRPQPRWS